MKCDELLISCSIEELGRTLTGWDWGSFVTTLLATLVGAAITGFLAWLVFHSERKERRRTAWVDVIAALVEELSAYMQRLKEYDDAKAFADEAREKTLGATDIRTHKPDMIRPATAIQRTLLKAQGREVEVISALQRAIFSGDDESTLTAFGSAATSVRVLTDWTRGSMKDDEAISMLNGLPESARESE